jgi:hypothetical protein
MKLQFKLKSASMKALSRSGGGALLLLPSLCFGFGESLCYDGKSWYNCVGKTVPLECYDTQAKLENPSDACLTAAFNDANAIAGDTTTPKIEEAHNLQTYIIAQALGMKPTAAFWVAIYSSVPDFGDIFPIDKFGNKMNNCPTLGTERFRGTNRQAAISQFSAGHVLHFPNPYDTTTATGANPDFSDPHEGASTSLMDFVLQKRGNACIAGATSNSVPGAISAAGEACYHSELKDTTIPSATNPQQFFHYPIGRHGYTGDVFVDYTPALTPPSAIATHVTNPVFLEDVQSVLDSKPGRYENGPVPDDLYLLALALHVKADRISHAECLDNSPMTIMTSPPAHVGHLLFSASDDNCGGFWHAWRHFMEFGTDFKNEKITSFVAMTYDDIEAFLELYPAYKDAPENLRLVAKEELQSVLTSASKMPNARSRMEKYDALINSYKMQPLPGHDPGYKSGECPSF